MPAKPHRLQNMVQGCQRIYYAVKCNSAVHMVKLYEIYGKLIRHCCSVSSLCSVCLGNCLARLRSGTRSFHCAVRPKIILQTPQLKCVHMRPWLCLSSTRTSVLNFLREENPALRSARVWQVKSAKWIKMKESGVSKTERERKEMILIWCGSWI